VAQECGISAMPTFQVFQNGSKVDEMVGAQKDKLAALVEKWAKA
jgi:thioredoxin 1